MAEAYTLSEDLSVEFEALQAIYSGEGEFTHQASHDTEYLCVVRLKPSHVSIGLQLSIPDGYPDKCPKIEFLPRDDDSQPVADGQPSDSMQLLQQLYEVATENKGTPMCFLLIETAKDWLMNRDETAAAEESVEHKGGANAVKEKEIIPEDDDETQVHHKSTKGSKSRKKPQEEEKIQGKKPRMKTATEVISRILWDEQLCQDHFVIGYLDRFLGVIEKPFSAFSWEDIASVDYDTLAIPKHRIQYFKYKDDIVWDKTKRLDNVFGSTGSTVTIIDVIYKYRKENESIEEKESDESVDGDRSSEEADGDGLDDDQVLTPHNRKNNRPNYFVAVRISNPDIVDQVQHIQTELCKLDSSLENTCTSLKQLHVTLCTLRLEESSQMEQAIAVLKEEQNKLKSLLAPATLLRFQGLQTFHDRVLCSVPQYNPVVMKLADYLCSAMNSAGLRIIGTPHDFTPHLTVLKITRKQIKQGQRGYLDHRLYKDHMQTDFGVQNVDSLHLCSMLDAPRQDGFYYSLASVDVLPEN